MILSIIVLLIVSPIVLGLIYISLKIVKAIFEMEAFWTIVIIIGLLYYMIR